MLLLLLGDLAVGQLGLDRRVLPAEVRAGDQDLPLVVDSRVVLVRDVGAALLLHEPASHEDLVAPQPLRERLLDVLELGVRGHPHRDLRAMDRVAGDHLDGRPPGLALGPRRRREGHPVLAEHIYVCTHT